MSSYGDSVGEMQTVLVNTNDPSGLILDDQDGTHANFDLCLDESKSAMFKVMTNISNNSSLSPSIYSPSQIVIVMEVRGSEGSVSLDNIGKIIFV